MKLRDIVAYLKRKENKIIRIIIILLVLLIFLAVFYPFIAYAVALVGILLYIMIDSKAKSKKK